MKSPPAKRMAKTRAARTKSGECVWCGSPVAQRVIEDADGVEVERRKMRMCAKCTMERRK